MGWYFPCHHLGNYFSLRHLGVHSPSLCCVHQMVAAESSWLWPSRRHERFCFNSHAICSQFKLSIRDLFLMMETKILHCSPFFPFSPFLLFESTWKHGWGLLTSLDLRLMGESISIKSFLFKLKLTCHNNCILNKVSSYTVGVWQLTMQHPSKE